MSGRVIGGALVGAAIVFVWGAVYWMGLPFTNMVIGGAASEGDFVESLRQHVGDSGAYVVPMKEHRPDMTAEDKRVAGDIWKGKHEMGPIALVFLRLDGATPGDPIIFVRGFLINVVGAMLLASLTSAAAGLGVNYARRVGLVFVVVVFGALVTHGVQWNWFYLPLDYSLVVFADVVVGWTLGGLAIAAIATPGKGKGGDETTPEAAA